MNNNIFPIRLLDLMNDLHQKLVDGLQHQNTLENQSADYYDQITVVENINELVSAYTTAISIFLKVKGNTYYDNMSSEWAREDFIKMFFAGKSFSDVIHDEFKLKLSDIQHTNDQ